MTIIEFLDRTQDKVKGWASLIALAVSLFVMIVQGVSKNSAEKGAAAAEHEQIKTTITQLQVETVKRQEMDDLKSRLDRIETKLDVLLEKTN